MTLSDRDAKSFTSSELARLLSVHVNTVRRWSDEGLIESQRIGRRGDRLFSQQDIDEFLKESERVEGASNSREE